MTPHTKLERIAGATRTFDVTVDGIWHARITLDPLTGIIIMAGGLTAAERMAVKLTDEYRRAY